jgi:hypothetical protein
MAGEVIEVKGLDKLVSQLDRMSGVGKRAADRGLQQAAQIVLDESLRRVPRDTGTLADSGHIDTSGGGVRVVFDAPYAALVHEKMSLKHPRGESKYLENAVNASESAAAEAFMTAMGVELRESL